MGGSTLFQHTYIYKENNIMTMYADESQFGTPKVKLGVIDLTAGKLDNTTVKNAAIKIADGIKAIEFSNCTFEHVYFGHFLKGTKRTFQQIVFQNCTFNKCNFTELKLEDDASAGAAIIKGCTFTNCELHFVHMPLVQIEHSLFKECSMYGASFANGYVRKCHFNESVYLIDAFAGALLHTCEIVNTVCRRGIHAKTPRRMIDVTFKQANIDGLRWVGTIFDNVSFTDCNMFATVFKGIVIANQRKLSFHRCILAHAEFNELTFVRFETNWDDLDPEDIPEDSGSEAELVFEKCRLDNAIIEVKLSDQYCVTMARCNLDRITYITRSDDKEFK